jgi:hypothetical protein
MLALERDSKSLGPIHSDVSKSSSEEEGVEQESRSFLALLLLPAELHSSTEEETEPNDVKKLTVLSCVNCLPATTYLFVAAGA